MVHVHVCYNVNKILILCKPIAYMAHSSCLKTCMCRNVTQLSNDSSKHKYVYRCLYCCKGDVNVM